MAIIQKGKYYYIVTYQNGKQKWVSTHCTDYKKAVEYEIRYNNGEFAKKGKRSDENNNDKLISDYIYKVKESYEKKKDNMHGIDITTYNSYQKYLKVLNDYFDEHPIKVIDFKRKNLNELYDYLSLEFINVKTGEKGLKHQTIMKYLTPLRTALDMAIDDEVIEHSVLNDFKRKEARQDRAKEQKFLNKDELSDLFDVLEFDIVDPQYKLFAFLCFDLGLRRSEAIALKRSDFNNDYTEVTINRKAFRQPGVGLLTEERLKSPASNNYLKLSKVLAEYVKEEFDRHPKSEWLFYDKSLNSFANPDKFSKHFRKIFDMLDLKDAHIHTLRHSLASLLAKGGKPQVDIQRSLRHQNMRTTNIYIHPSDEAVDNTAEYVDDLLSEERQKRLQNGTIRTIKRPKKKDAQ